MTFALKRPLLPKMAFKWAFFMVKMFQMVNLFHVEQCEGNLFRKTDIRGFQPELCKTFPFLNIIFHTLYILYKVIDTEKAGEKSHFRLNHHIGTF